MVPAFQEGRSRICARVLDLYWVHARATRIRYIWIQYMMSSTNLPINLSFSFPRTHTTNTSTTAHMQMQRCCTWSELPPLITRLQIHNPPPFSLRHPLPTQHVPFTTTSSPVFPAFLSHPTINNFSSFPFVCGQHGWRHPPSFPIYI